MTVAALLRRHPFDALVVLLAVVAEIKVWIVPGAGPKVVFIVASLLWTLPLLLRHRFPFAAPVFTFAVQAAASAADPTLGVETTGFVALLLSFWVVGAENERGQAIAGAAIGFASIVAVAELDTRVSLENAVWGIILGSVACLIAYALQRRAKRASELEERAAQLERDREERARAAVVAERTRIARDLHDVIAHSVSVMTVQAGAARLLLPEDPARAREPLLSVEETGREALAEMRRLFGIVRGEEVNAALAPQPGLARLDVLVEQARKAGLPVALTLEGERHVLPPGVDLTAYRIVQEALTNALKHARPARAQVTIRYGREALDIEITNDGRRARTGEATGHGLVGMRERVALYSGELEAGPRERGGYAVRARLPVEAESA
ncbi:MAG: sensor histidine kinase [Gaiellaceae bacterium]